MENKLCQTRPEHLAEKGKKKPKLSNDDDCPIHGPSRKWGQCHQNQYGDNFKPRKVGGYSINSSNYSQGRSRCEAYHTIPPNQVQGYINEARTQYSKSTSDTQSRNSHSTAPSFRFPPGYPNQNNNNNNYQDNFIIETYKNIDNKNKDFLPEGTIPIRHLNAQDVDNHTDHNCPDKIQKRPPSMPEWINKMT